jgi:hypothetical protein
VKRTAKNSFTVSSILESRKKYQKKREKNFKVNFCPEKKVGND